MQGEKRRYILHACYHPDTPDSLFIFGEDSECTAPKRRGRKPKIPAITPHPHALSHSTLTELLMRYHPSAQNAEGKTIILNLPGRDGVPLLSDDPATGENINFIQTEIPALSIPISHLSHLFTAMNERQHDGTRCRDSITFFRHAFGFALEFISRELFIPGSGEKGPNPGEWVAVFTPDERDRASRLSQAMPGICSSWKDGGYQPEQVLQTFINACVTTVMKAACQHHPLTLHGRARSGSNPASLLLMTLWGEASESDTHKASLATISGKLHEWLLPLIPDEKSRPFFTCIRLREPSEASTIFQLEFLLQASDDPSLVIPAEEIWKKRSGTITYLHHRFENPQEQILADLYKAGRIFPPVRDALRSRTPSGLVLESEMVVPIPC
jgi:hypothetical protein